MDIPKKNNSHKSQPNTPFGSPKVYGSSPKIGEFNNYMNNNLTLTSKIPISTYHSEGKWVQFRRGDIYREQVNINEMPEVDPDGFTTVRRNKTPKAQYIYYWHLYAHNLYSFDYGKQNNLSLYFCHPDYQIYQNDKVPQYAIDPCKPNEVVPLIFFAKWDNLKFKPIAFIAKNEQQIKEALEHISYCIVEKNEDGRLEMIHEDQLLKKKTSDDDYHIQ